MMPTLPVGHFMWLDVGFYLVLAMVFAMDAYLVTSTGLPSFVGTAVHVALIACSGANIYELQRVMKEKDAHDRVERMQCELITNLSLYNSKLLAENKILAYKLDRASGVQLKSRSCGNMTTL